MITDEQHKKFIISTVTEKVIVAVAQAHNGIELINLYWHYGYFVPKPIDGFSLSSLPILKEIPSFSSSISEVMRPVSKNSHGVIKLRNSDNEITSYEQYSFNSQSIILYVGQKDWVFSDFRVVFSGYFDTAGLQRTGDYEYTLKLLGVENLMDVPFQRRQENNKEIIQCIGTVFNVEPVLVDKANHEYRVEQYLYKDILEMRWNGEPVVEGVAYKIGEAGTPRLYADQGLVRLITNPATSKITCDIQGRLVNSDFKPDVTGTQINKASDIVRAILYTKTAIQEIQIDDTSFDKLNISRPETLGLYDNKGSVSDQVAKILSSVFSFIRFNKANSKLELKLFQIPEHSDIPDWILEASDFQSITFVTSQPAPKSITVGYRQNYTIQTSGLSGTIIDNDTELVDLYGRENTTVTYSNTIFESTITLVQWQSGNLIKYTFTDNPATVILGMVLSVFDCAETLNNGSFVVVSTGTNYIIVTNTNRSDAVADETTGGIADVMPFNFINTTEKKTIDTLIHGSSDADDIAEEIATAFESGTEELKVVGVFSKIVLMNIGDTVLVKTDKAGLESTTCIITGINGGLFQGDINIIRKQ
jgi:hypothetical protein